MRRAVESVALPAGKGTTNVMRLDGKSWAAAMKGASTVASANTNALRNLRVMLVSLLMSIGNAEMLALAP